jgi:hypothetical protein
MRKFKKTAKKYFVPHKGNSYHPHVFRRTFIVTTVILCAFFLGVLAGNKYFINKTVLGVSIASNVLIDLANETREASKVPLLERNKKLDRAAMAKIDHMVSNKYFSHNSPNGVTPWYFINKVGYIFIYAGENLAMDFTDSWEVQNAWLNSPTHKANLLNSNFKDIGISTREVFFNGRKTVFIVQMFGTESSLSKGLDLEEEGSEKKDFVEDIRIANSENLEKIVEDDNFIAVRNWGESDEVNPVPVVAGVSEYSTWWQRLLVSFPFYIQVSFLTLLLLVIVATLIRMFVEFKRQHTSHLVISVIFLLFVLAVASVSLNF